MKTWVERMKALLAWMQILGRMDDLKIDVNFFGYKRANGKKKKVN
jgi:hypothetical protein